MCAVLCLLLGAGGGSFAGRGAGRAASVFERLRAILHEGAIDKRCQYMIEGLFAVRKVGLNTCIGRLCNPCLKPFAERILRFVMWASLSHKSVSFADVFTYHLTGSKLAL